jgi:hypothetical protein
MYDPRQRGDHDGQICGNAGWYFDRIVVNHRGRTRSGRADIQSIEPTYQPSASGCGRDHRCDHMGTTDVRKLVGTASQVPSVSLGSRRPKIVAPGL